MPTNGSLLNEFWGILRWVFTWDFIEWAKDQIRNTTWGKAMVTAMATVPTAVVAWLTHHPFVCVFALGAAVAAVIIFCWAWIDLRRDSYLKPLIPDALRAIDQRIDIVWNKHFASASADIIHLTQIFKEDLKYRLRLMLTALNMVKTREEYALEQIAKITKDKDHPFNHPEDSFHEMALRRMIELKEMAYMKKDDSD